MIQGFNSGASPISQGASIYIFDRKNFKLIPATVINVSSPHVSKATASNPTMVFQGFVVDLTLSVNNETKTVEFPVNNVSANYNDLGWFISADNLVVSREVENTVSAAKQFMAQVPYNEKIIQEGPGMITQLNPDKQKEARQEERIEAMEKQFRLMTDKFNEVAGMLLNKSSNPTI